MMHDSLTAEESEYLSWIRADARREREETGAVALLVLCEFCMRPAFAYMAWPGEPEDRELEAKMRGWWLEELRTDSLNLHVPAYLLLGLEGLAEVDDWTAATEVWVPGRTAPSFTGPFMAAVDYMALAGHTCERRQQSEDR